MGVKLRQVALAAHDLDVARTAIEAELGLRDPFADPGVGEFGLVNAVYEVGDTFLEVVVPARADTTAGRYLERRGHDAGYMALFQVDDTAAARARVASLGIRTIWQVDLADISGTHLHPKDVPGAIVSFDTPDPAVTWRWGGPRWTGSTPAVRYRSGAGITGLVVQLVDAEAGCAAWAAALGLVPTGTELILDDGRQRIRFEPTGEPSDEGIAVIEIDELPGDTVVGGVHFRSSR